MSLQEFDSVMDRMKLSFEYANNLGQYVEATKILFQINEQLPDGIQLNFEELNTPDMAKSFILKYESKLKSAIAEYRQSLMNF